MMSVSDEHTLVNSHLETENSSTVELIPLTSTKPD